MLRASKIVISTLLIGLLLLTSACRKQVPSEVVNVDGQSFELSLTTIQTSENEAWENTITRATIFIFRHDDIEHNTAPLVKYIFSDLDIARSTALIPMAPDFLVGEQLDIYAIINSRDTNIYRTNKPFTRSELAQLYDSSAISRYNNSSYIDLQRAIISTGGFMMAGTTTATLSTQQIQPLNVEVTRTVSRIDLHITTDQAAFRRYVTNLGEPNATLQIVSAWLLRSNRRAPVFGILSSTEDDYRPPYNRRDSLVQGNDKLLPNLYDGEFRFYTMPTKARGTINYPFTDDRNNEAVKLVIRAIYNADKTSMPNVRDIYFTLPLQGGGDASFAAAINGNTLYRVNVVVAGIGNTISSDEFLPTTKSGQSHTTSYIVGLER